MRSWLAAAVLLACSASPAAARAQAPDPESDQAKQGRLAWFREAKYGLFIHWGLYAIPGGQWKGERVPGIGEWIMFRARVPVPEYEKLAQGFNPVKFDAAAWVALAKDAGMKYMVITSKHHDGFALFDSKVSRYDVVDATPFKRDILKELAAACQKQGMPLGFYYSQAQDWNDPNGAGNTWDYGPDEKKDFDKPRVPFELPPMKNAVKRAYRLADAQPVEVKVEEGRPRLVIERPILDPTATVVVVEIEGDAVRK
jgi:alpha-L-fucosidase